jgi:hypothetical protein
MRQHYPLNRIDAPLSGIFAERVIIFAFFGDFQFKNFGGKMLL